MSEQAVIVAIPGQTRVDLDRLGPELSAAATTVPAGEYDGHEVGPDGLTMYLYAENADKLADAVIPILTPRLRGSTFTVRRRYGEPGSREISTTFG